MFSRESRAFEAVLGGVHRTVERRPMALLGLQIERRWRGGEGRDWGKGGRVKGLEESFEL